MHSQTFVTDDVLEWINNFMVYDEYKNLAM